MDNSVVDGLIALPTRLEGEQVKRLFDDLVESRKTNDLLEKRIIALEERERVSNAKLEDLLASLRKYKVFSDGIKIEELRDEVDSLNAQMAKMRSMKPPGKKTEERKEKLAVTLMYRKNIGMTYAEIGKMLELGSRRNGKNTREQNMTHFGKLLEADKKNFVVTDGRTNGGKLVKLTKTYFEHLVKEYMPEGALKF